MSPDSPYGFAYYTLCPLVLSLAVVALCLLEEHHRTRLAALIVAAWLIWLAVGIWS